MLSMDFVYHADFKDDPEIYVFPKLKYVGIELWQVIFFAFMSVASILTVSYVNSDK